MLAAATAIPERPVTFTLSLASLRETTVSLSGTVDVPDSRALRVAVDGTDNGIVSPEEYTVLASALDYAIKVGNLSTSSAYAYVWDLENGSGSAPFTVSGRANVTALVLSTTPPSRLNCTLDGEPGRIARVAVSFENLAGPVAQRFG